MRQHYQRQERILESEMVKHEQTRRIIPSLNMVIRLNLPPAEWWKAESDYHWQSTECDDDGRGADKEQCPKISPL